jgi:hypothetical protein
MLEVEGSLGDRLPLNHLTGEVLLDGIRDAKFEVIGVEAAVIRHGEETAGSLKGIFERRRGNYLRFDTKWPACL